MAEIYPLSVYIYEDLSLLPQLTFPLMPKEEFSNDFSGYYQIPNHSIKLTYPRADKESHTLFDEWKKSGVVKKLSPHLYKYSQEYTHPYTGKILVRTGILAGLKVEEWSAKSVLPHENINIEVVEQGLHFLDDYNVNSAPIHLLLSENETHIRSLFNSPARFVTEFSDSFGVKHKLEIIDDKTINKEIINSIKKFPLFLADGHHRYQTMITYNKKYEKNALIPAFISLMKDEPSTILPFHRIVKLSSFQENKLLNILKQYFILQPITEKCVEANTSIEDEGSLGLILKSQSFILKPINEKVKHFINKKVYIGAKEKMALIDYLLVKYLENLKKEEPKNWFNLKFSYNFTKLCQKVHSGEADFGLILKGIDMKVLKKTALSDSILPEKSTFFYPKMLAGLIFYDLTDLD